MTPLFSIIIPHKNTPDLLRRCLDSIPRREDIEIIVADDGSDPSVVDFARFPGLGDKAVDLVFTKGGRGGGGARNAGLERAAGKWLVFADADDFFLPGAFEMMTAYAESEEDILFFKCTSCDSDTLEPSDRDEYVNQFVDAWLRNDTDAEGGLRFVTSAPWGKMIRRSLVTEHEVRFDETLTSNDVMFSLKTGCYARSVRAVDLRIYCVTQRRGSLTYIVSYQAAKSRFTVLCRRNYFLQENNQNKYIMPEIPLIVRSLKYGAAVFIEFIKITAQYKCNPFKNFHLGRVVRNRILRLFHPEKTDRKKFIAKGYISTTGQDR